MEKTIKSSRSAYWDNIKGLLMLLVVFAHVLFQLQHRSDAIDATVDYIYMFHMPAFVFVSGFFGKSERSRSFESVVKLIFLYFVFNSVTGFIYGFDSLLEPMYSYWYLLALIAWRVVTPRVAGFKEIRLVVFVTALFVGFYPSVNNAFAAARIIGFFPYYLLGYQLGEDKSAELVGKKYAKRASAGLLFLALAAALAFGAYRFFRYTDGALQMEAYGDQIDAFGRIALYVIALLAIYAFRNLSPDRKLPLLTTFGRNSLWIFVLHRPFTLLVSDRLMRSPISTIMIVSGSAAFVICIAFGNDLVAKLMNRFLADGAGIFTSGDKKFNLAKLAALCVSVWFVFSAVLDSYKGVTLDDIKNMGKDDVPPAEENAESSEDDVIFPVMSAEEKAAFDGAFRITFAGDLILLEDQVKRAYNGKEYDFSEVFERAEPYISSADFAIGVFEGPMAGEEAGYTSSNFDDEKDLALNYPDEFASAVKAAGFDLVTTANNHLFDKGEKGVKRTIDVLDKIGLDHTGSYRDAEEKAKNRVKLVESQGIKMAFLSYAYGSNNIDTDKLAEGEYSYATSVISGTGGERFERLKKSVEEDFRAAKALSPDLIIVLPHIGTQFSNEPDEEQKVWFDIFKENGADIILGDHAHVVQPALIEDYNGRKVYTAYCPGNFANLYRKNQGDTSMLAEVYIDRGTKEIIGGSVVPLYTYAPADGNYRAVPVYDVANDAELRKSLTTDDTERAANANSRVTEVVFGRKTDISFVTERYYFNEKGFLRSKAEPLDITSGMKKGTLFKAIDKAESVCFVGDSVTEGTKNGGCPWYEPIEGAFPEKAFSNYSKGGCTAQYMLRRAAEIPEAELYVIALGTNDVRYRDESSCAMTAEEYVKRLGALKDKLLEKSPGAEFVFVAPWYSTDGDPFCSLSFKAKTELNEEYCDALGEYCKEGGFGYVNANGRIREALAAAPDSEYLLDHIHPNASKGVKLYSEAALS